jgi:hypothetical protein
MNTSIGMDCREVRSHQSHGSCDRLHTLKLSPHQSRKRNGRPSLGHIPTPLNDHHEDLVIRQSIVPNQIIDS